MKICFFGTYNRAYSRNQILLNGLKEKNIEVVEVHYQLHQMKIENKSHVGLTAVFHRLVRKLLFFPVLVRKFPQIKTCDVIFCAYPAHVDLPLAWIVAKLSGKPLVFDPMFSLTDVFTNDFKILKTGTIFAKIFQFYEKIIFSLPDIVLADTPYQKENYIKLFNIPMNKIQVVPLGADNTLYNNTGDIMNKNGTYKVVYYGLYNPIHGVEYIIEAAKILKDKKGLEFLMIGDGQTHVENVALAQKYNLKNVKFMKLMEKDALPILKTADIFLGLFASSDTVFRAIPNKVLQGLALNKPVIMMDGPAIRSVFEHGKHIFLIPPEDAYSLSLAILKIKSDKNLETKLKKEGYKIYMEKFTPEAVAGRLIEVIKDL